MINEIKSELAKFGLDELVTLSVEKYENDFGKMVPHMVAKWVGIDFDGNDEVKDRIEEMNKWFSPTIFAMGITQRADWIKASTEDKLAFYAEAGGFKHPAMYKAA
jgi:hypothetical protein